MLEWAPNPTPIPMSQSPLRRFSNSWDLSSNRPRARSNHLSSTVRKGPRRTDFTARTPGLRWRNDLRSCLLSRSIYIDLLR